MAQSRRLQLHDILISLLTSENVYFQPPPSFKMEYPCIVYNRNKIRTEFANNSPYKHAKEYTVTIIDADPDSEFPDILASLPQCIHDRSFKSQGLNHDVFVLIY